MSPGPKKWLESCVSRFSTICAKNKVLKLKIDKVTVIRVYANAPFERPSPVGRTMGRTEHRRILNLVYPWVHHVLQLYVLQYTAVRPYPVADVCTAVYTAAISSPRYCVPGCTRRYGPYSSTYHLRYLPGSPRGSSSTSTAVEVRGCTRLYLGRYTRVPGTWYSST
jgi:hypothetical protein